MARPRQVSDAQILGAARECFLAVGPGASLDQIGAALGISGQALLRRFGSKAELMTEALIPDELTDWRVLVDEAAGSRDGVVEQLTQIAVALHAVLSRILPAAEVLKAAGFQERDLWAESDVAPPEAARRAVARWLRARRKEGALQTSKPDAVAQVVLAIVHHRAFLEHAGLSDLHARSGGLFQAEIEALSAGLGQPGPGSRSIR